MKRVVKILLLILLIVPFNVFAYSSDYKDVVAPIIGTKIDDFVDKNFYKKMLYQALKTNAFCSI